MTRSDPRASSFQAWLSAQPKFGGNMSLRLAIVIVFTAIIACMISVYIRAILAAQELPGDPVLYAALGLMAAITLGAIYVTGKIAWPLRDWRRYWRERHLAAFAATRFPFSDPQVQFAAAVSARSQRPIRSPTASDTEVWVRFPYPALSTEIEGGRVVITTLPGSPAELSDPADKLWHAALMLYVVGFN